eukprot:6472283-Amphidinium_carterae.1
MQFFGLLAFRSECGDSNQRRRDCGGRVLPQRLNQHAIELNATSHTSNTSIIFYTSADIAKYLPVEEHQQ